VGLVVTNGNNKKGIVVPAYALSYPLILKKLKNLGFLSPH
jgi:hypothetical protein